MGKVVGFLAVVLLAACGPFGADNGPVEDDLKAADEPKKAASSSADPSDDSIGEQLDAFFAEELNQGNIPGLAVGVVGNGRVKWSKGYGYADLATKKSVTQDTLFSLAGVSTAVTTVAFLQLAEDSSRGITLDSDINTFVGFNVRNPSSPSTPITIRMLLTHTASLADDVPTSTVGDAVTPLATYVKTAVEASSSWGDAQPGTKYVYANLGLALIGLAVEKLSGQSLEEYSKAHVFGPLGMNETSWFLKNLDQKHIAQPYEGPEHTPQGFYGAPDYPAGQLRTSAFQLAQFALMIAQGGEVGAAKVLGSKTLATMEKVQLPSVNEFQALTLFHDERGGRAVVGLDGADRGAHVELFVEPLTKSGYVLLLNTDHATKDDAFERSMQRMSAKLMTLTVTLP